MMDGTIKILNSSFVAHSHQVQEDLKAPLMFIVNQSITSNFIAENLSTMPFINEQHDCLYLTEIRITGQEIGKELTTDEVIKLMEEFMAIRSGNIKIILSEVFS